MPQDISSIAIRLNKLPKRRNEKADNILKVASEQARLIESGSRDNAAKLLKSAETDIKDRRGELNRETERLDKRRGELDSRFDKMEQREQR